MNRLLETLTQWMFQNLFLKEKEITCLLKRDLSWWSRNIKSNLVTSVSVSFSNKLMLNDWIWRTPITDLLTLDKNKFDNKKNESWERKSTSTNSNSKHTRDGAQELRVDEVSVQKLRESHETIQRLTSQVQDLQERKNYWNDSGEFHEFPVNQQSPRAMLSCDKRLRQTLASWHNGNCLDHRKTFLQIHGRHSSHHKHLIKEFIHLWHQVLQVRLPRSQAQGDLWQERNKE